MPGKYMRSYIKTLHIQENRHYSINATKQLILHGPYWWPTITKDISLLITLCEERNGKGDELPKEVDLSSPNTSKEFVPYKETTEDWRTPLIKYMTHGELRARTNSQQKQREIIHESENFTLEGGKLKRLKKNGTTKYVL